MKIKSIIIWTINLS